MRWIWAALGAICFMCIMSFPAMSQGALPPCGRQPDHSAAVKAELEFDSTHSIQELLFKDEKPRQVSLQWNVTNCRLTSANAVRVSITPGTSLGVIPTEDVPAVLGEADTPKRLGNILKITFNVTPAPLDLGSYSVDVLVAGGDLIATTQQVTIRKTMSDLTLGVWFVLAALAGFMWSYAVTYFDKRGTDGVTRNVALLMGAVVAGVATAFVGVLKPTVLDAAAWTPDFWARVALVFAIAASTAGAANALMVRALKKKDKPRAAGSS